ncbi:MAG: hypothetical protein K1X29_11135 [Bdellovibrionales bacterium]|nr:hypothetical protein [Bdellovibrionales bacterium]
MYLADFARLFSENFSAKSHSSKKYVSFFLKYKTYGISFLLNLNLKNRTRNLIQWGWIKLTNGLWDSFIQRDPKKCGHDYKLNKGVFVESSAHYRRCHLCGAVSTQFSHPVDKCQHCHKSWAPFYYFDDRLTKVSSDLSLREGSIEQEFPPLQGLTVYWNTGDT